MLLQFHEIGYSQPAHGVLHFVGEAVVYRLCIDAVPGPQKMLMPAERQKPLAAEHCIDEQAMHVDPPDSPVLADGAVANLYWSTVLLDQGAEDSGRGRPTSE